jgi:hypothetical protein
MNEKGGQKTRLYALGFADALLGEDLLMDWTPYLKGYEYGSAIKATKEYEDVKNPHNSNVSKK